MKSADPTAPVFADRCKRCGEVFSLIQEEVDFYKDKKLLMPKRCQACRQKRRGDREHGDGAH